MKIAKNPLLGLGLAAVFAGLAAGSDAESGESAVAGYKTYKKWEIILPGEQWATIQDVIPIAHAEGEGFAVEITGPLALAVDTNADGKTDKKVKGVGGFLKLRGKDEHGGTINYAVRIRSTVGGWQYAASGAMQTKLAGQMVRVIDQNNNGIYDEYGVDAMIVGSGDDASYLSKVVNIAGDLYDFEVSSDGREMSIEPFSSEVGTVALASSFKSNGKLKSAVILDRSRDYSFNVAGHRSGLRVPAGTYEFASGFAKRGGESCWIKTGKMRPLEVKPDEKTSVTWGAPVVADFSWTVAAGTVTVNPDVIFYGQAGEVYHSFKPDAKSPKLIFRDKKRNKIVLEARFPGC
ncbi:MAG: hypothetical protein O7B99_12335 [Planctomycetota bacterium]|nr:hypothetical protein [Planctomycetota bacterium]